MKVIDDSYNSNEKSFVQAVEYLGRQKPFTRVLVTPGLLELGNESNKIHEQLGTRIIGNADLVILVGNNERTAALELGINKKVKVFYIDKTLQFMQYVNNLKLKKEPIVLLENDIPENNN
jgi:UDP-N-acetylmuramoyl-tripeptide--D-alanyl-D-alanine ligase